MSQKEKKVVNDSEELEFEKSFVDFLENKIQDINIAEEQLKKGHRVSYVDSKKRWIREYPNGKKYLLNYNPVTREITEGEEILD